MGMDSDEDATMVYELLEECIASKSSTKFFLAGYRLFYSTEDVWNAIQQLHSRYRDAKTVRDYIWRCLRTWFKVYCLHDLKDNRGLANEVFIFTSKRFHDKKLTAKLKTLFIQQIAQEDPPPIQIPLRCEAFGQPVPLYHCSSFSVEEVAEAFYMICVNRIKTLSLGPSLKKDLSGTMSSLFDHVTYHISSHILWGKQARIRAKEYQFFIKVAIRLRWRYCYEMSFAVYQGLIQSSVAKLNRTLKKVSNASKKSLATLDFLFDPREGYKNYLREISTLKGLYVPIFSILKRQLQNTKGPKAVKIAGKILLPIVNLQKRPIASPNPQLKEVILQPPFSVQQLEELSSLRENSTSSSSESSESEYSDHELSPRPFGTPRHIPTLPLSEISPKSPLRKTISFPNLSPRPPRDPSPRSPRPLSRSRIVRTMKIRDLKQQLRNPMFWTCEKVGEWLQENDMGEYELEFLSAQMDGPKLLKSSLEDLRQLGVDSDDGLLMLEKIQKLHEK